MITLREAIKIAERERGSKVVSASDCGDRWAFGFEVDLPDQNELDPEIPEFAREVLACRQAVDAFVFKSDGKCEMFLFAYIADSVFNGDLNFVPVALSEA